MAFRKILKEGDPTLNKVCRPVTNFDGRLHELIDDMRETLETSNGLGLAAPQVGILRRVVLVIDGAEEMIELVNPVLLVQDGEQDGFEGCLSVPGMYGEVLRPAYVKVRAQDRDGAFFEVEGTGMTARCFCHELEHLDGHLFTEHTERLYTIDELDELAEKEHK